MIFFWIAVAVLVIAFMILTHEMGHYFAAKAVGIGVQQFSIGFGPEIVGWDRGATRYSLKWILAGGSVKILGMNPDEEVSEEDRPRSYYEAPPWKRALVVVAGSLVHIVIALILFYMFFWPIGYPVLTGRVGEVQQAIEVSDEEVYDSPAYRAGLKKGDLILSVDGVPVQNWGDLRSELNARPGEEVTLKLERDGETLTREVRLLDIDGMGILGVAVDLKDTYIERSDPITAVGQAFKTTGEVTVLLAEGFASLFSLRTLKMLLGMEPRAEDSPRSVVGAAQLTFQAAGQGASVFIFVLAQLFLFLALFNLLPLPPFDGGHLVVIAVEKFTGKRIDVRKLMPLAWAVIIVLSIVALRLALLDIFNPIKNPFQP